MKKLGSHFPAPVEEIKSKISDMVSSLEVKDFDRASWRRQLEQDFEIRQLDAIGARKTGFIGVDSSITAQNLRYHALWSMHCVSLYGLFDGKDNEDPLVGHGFINYSNLMYDSSIDLGSFNPYWMIEQQMNYIRIAKEYSTLFGGYEKLVESGVEVDFALVDGSLKTNSENLSVKTSLNTVDKALDAQEKLLGLKRVVSMAEDSHSSDISRKFGLNMSNLMLFNIVLDEGEYVVDAGKFNVCYIKLPGKKLAYLGGKSTPTTVRWEFSYPGFEDDLSLIASIWLREIDLLHPQVYPLRIADYLTRRVKTAGLLSEVAREINSDLEFREMREV